MIDTMAIQENNLSTTMNSLEKVADSNLNSLMTVDKPKNSSFSGYLTSAMNEVNQSQLKTTTLEKKYINEDPGTSLSSVMLQMEKSQVALTSMLAVRNKFIDAYKQVTNMNI